MSQLLLKSIGRIQTPYSKLADCPRNIDPKGPECSLILYDDFHNAMMGLKAEQEIMILYWLDDADRNVVLQNSRRTGELAGVFALRTPNRPNPIGAAVLPIKTIEEGVITVRGLDCLDGTCLIDIKPAMAGE